MMNLSCRNYCEGFSEVPSNITLLIGSDRETVFRCHHESTELAINWMINGMFFNGQFSGVMTAIENGTRVHTLTIPARSEYNGKLCTTQKLDFNMR